MSSITPEQARDLLGYGEDGIFEKPIGMIAMIAVEATQTIAAMTYEYGEQHIVIPGRLEHTTWGVNPEEVRQLPGYGDHIHIVRRLVSTPEVMGP